MYCTQKCFVCCAWLWWKCARPKRHLMSIIKKNEAKKVMVRKTVEIRSDDVGGDGGIVVCEESDSTKQRKRAPNVICMRLNRLDGRRSAWLQLTDCEFILFTYTFKTHLFILCAVPAPTNSFFPLRLNVNTIIIWHLRVHINISFANPWFASGATATRSTWHTAQ